MFLSRWLDRVQQKLSLSSRRTSRRGGRLGRESRREWGAARWVRAMDVAPRAEWLEDRALLSTITVTSLADNTTGDGAVTLREAIRAAQTDSSVDGSTAGSGADTIAFAPSLFTSGDQTLTLTLFDTGLDTTEFGATAFVVSKAIAHGKECSWSDQCNRSFRIAAWSELTDNRKRPKLTTSVP